MIKRAWQKFFIYFFAVLFAVSPLVNVYTAFGSLTGDLPKAKAADTEEGNDVTTPPPSTTDKDESDEGALDDRASGPDNPDSLAASTLAQLSARGNTNQVLTAEERLGVTESPRLVLMPTDMKALRVFYYFSMIDATPDFSNVIEDLQNNLPEDTVAKLTALGAPMPPDMKWPFTKEELTRYKYENADLFNHLVAIARDEWKSNPTKAFTFLSNEAVAGILDKTVNQVKEMSVEEKKTEIQAAAERYKMDIRVLKTMVYLLTPKNQGGAGHWRIRIRKIMQNQSTPLSTESDATIASKEGSTVAKNKSTDCTGLTAADCGAKAREATGGASDADIVDQDGTQYDGYVTTTDASGQKNIVSDSEDAELTERNISAHTDGQALDISELDDIRCTLVVIKHKRIGGSSTTKTTKPAKPIKLAWQSTDGYAQSGGNPVDMMGIMRQALTENFRELIDGLGGDVSSYDGDLSQADMSDVIEIVGRSLFAQIINSPSHNLAGYDTEDTMQKLGSMYFADYFGLPRELFLNKDITGLDEVEAIIGQAAVEKRLNIPFGSLSSYNRVATAINLGSTDEEIRRTKVYNLEGSFLNVGQAKLEYEMGLTAGSLDGYVSLKDDTSSPFDKYDFIGRRLIEQQLNIKKDSFAGNTYQDIRNRLTVVKADLIFTDPTYADNKLHLDPGTTKKLVSGALTPTAYAKLVGQIRVDDTQYGLLHFAAENSAYNLPEGMWEKAINGDRKGIRTVGLYFLSQLFSTPQNSSELLELSDEEKALVSSGKLVVKSEPENLGAEALRKWLLDSTARSGDTCKATDEIKIDVTYTLTKTLQTRAPGSGGGFGGGTPAIEEVTTETKTKEITLSEDKMVELGLEYGDLHNMYGCIDSSSKFVFERVGSKLLNYAVANKALNPGQKSVIDLLDTDPELHTTNPEILFYTNRIKTIQDSSEKIRRDWAGEDASELAAIKSQIDRVIRFAGTGVDLTSSKSMERMGRDLGPEVGKLKNLFQQRRTWLPAKIGKINSTITDINRITVATAEILSGKPIKNADDLTLDQISYSSSLAGMSGDNGARASCGDASASRGFNASMLFGLFTRNITPAELFVKIGSANLEAQLNLPVNSLYYLVQNYEKKGIHGADAFYQAIGQARIEAEFCMPSFYFQGSEFGKDMPDFANNTPSLVDWAWDTVNDSYIIYRWRTGVRDSGPAWLVLTDYVNTIKRSDVPLYDAFISIAKTKWMESEKAKAKAAGVTIVEKTLTDVATNAKASGFTDGIRSGEADVLFRMGIGGSTFAGALMNTSALRTMDSIDRRLGLKTGSTQNLLKNKSVTLAKGEDLLDNEEKSQVVSWLGITPDSLDTYLRLLNGDIKLTDISGVGVGPSYNYVNRYAAQPNDTACPIVYTLEDPAAGDGAGSFEVSNKYMENDTYCISDKKGRHCFKNREEATRYQNSASHKTDQFENVVALMGSITAFALDYLDPDKDAEYADKITQLINGSSNQALTEDEIRAIVSRPTSDETVPPSADTLKKLYWNNFGIAPLQDYKAAVGKIEAKAILTSKIFDSLGISIDPALFDSGSVYQILNGNFSSLFAVGARMLDNSLGVKPGTSMMIYYAANPANRACALSQAGATILGSFLGLQSVSVSGNIMNNIGQAKIEETLHLPRGSFRGANIGELMEHVKPLTFALAFKIPISGTEIITDDEMIAIMGDRWSRGDTSERYKLQALYSFLSNYYSDLNGTEASALGRVEADLMVLLLTLVGHYKAGNLGTFVPEDNPKYKIYKEEVAEFRQLLVNMDSWFGLTANTTSSLFMGIDGITPDKYTNLVGQKKLTVVALTQFALAMGLNDRQADAVAGFVTSFSAIFHCSREEFYRDARGRVTTRCADPNYGNLGLVYGYLSNIFNLNLDSRANLDPGTFQAVLSNPAAAGTIILSQMPKMLDAKLGLTGDYTFTSLYWWFKKADTEAGLATRTSKDQECNTAADDALAGLNERQRANDSILRSKTASEEEKRRADADSWEVARAMSTVQSNLNACKIAARTYPDTTYRDPVKHIDYAVTAYGWVQENVARTIHNKLANVEIEGQNVGINMPVEDIKTMLFQGNLTYFTVAAMAVGVNWFTDALGIDRAVPAGMRISYADLKMAYFPDAAALKASRDAATWAYLHGEAYNPSADVIGYGDICPPDGSVFGSLFSCTPGETIGRPRDSYSIIGSNSTESFQRFGCFDPTTRTNRCADTNGDTILNEMYAAAGAADSAYATHLATPPSCTRTDCAAEWATYDAEGNRLGNAAAAKNAEISILTRQQKDAESQAQKAFRDALQYRMIDMMLWQNDKNIFPGFSRALMQGNWDVKKGAIAMYLKRGIMSGKLFGVDFEPVEGLNTWLAAARFIYEHGDSAAFETFVSGGGFNSLANYITQRSEKWFGFALTPDISQGLLLGVTTGQWGYKDGVDTRTVGRTVIPSFEKATKSWAEGRIFAWADKQLGLPAGTSYKWFDMGREIYYTTRTYNQISNAISAGGFSTLGGLSDADKLRLISSIDPKYADPAQYDRLLDPDGNIYAFQSKTTGEVVKFQDVRLEGAQKDAVLKANADKRDAVVGAMKTQLLTMIVSYFAEKWLGAAMRELEKQWGLVPGSLSIIMEAMVGYGVGLAAHAWGWLAKAPTLEGLLIALAIFILVNLFGVYKVETYYYCDADGYYPSIDGQWPDANQFDVTDVGVWDAMKDGVNEAKTIQSAQYKARRLLQDMLTMHQNPLYADVYPNQMMTGRDEDVQYLNYSITNNLCSAIGMDAINGICGGADATRVGVWSNPQTVAWTHIGF